MVPKLQGRYGKVSDLRGLNAVILQSVAFPDLLAYVNGIFFDTAYRYVSPAAVKNQLFRGRSESYSSLIIRSRAEAYIFSLASPLVLNSIEHIHRLGNGLFQSVVQPHKLFTEFVEHGNRTNPIVHEDSGEVSVRACYLRLGSGDETHVQSRSQIRVPINIKSGRFHDVGYTPEWLETRLHPTSHMTFAGNVIPAFQACVRTVTELHKKVPYVRCIGWDVTVDREENVRLLEWKAGHNGHSFPEATQGPCFTDLGWERLRNERAE